MTALEDLVRDTLAERAHDVDCVQLNAPAVRTHPSRRWVAIGAVVAAAAAILVAVVLVAPWRGTTGRNAVGAPTPPAGMQWVSYHGITVTVPADWVVSDLPCAVAPGHTGLVAIDAGAASVSCSRMPIADATGPKTTVSLAVVVTTAHPAGDVIRIDGHDAYRTFVHQASGSYPAPSAYGQVVVPDVRVAVAVGSDSAQSVEDVLDSIEYTPVDHLGCVNARPDFGPDPAADTRLPDDIVSGVVCQYEVGSLTQPGSLLGSRRLGAADLDGIRAHAQDPTSAQPVPAADPNAGDRVYRLTRADGSTCTLTARPSAGTVEWADFSTTPLSATTIENGLPGAYP